MASPPADTGHRREHRRQNLQRLLQPRQVAVIGGGAAVATIRQLDHIGFTGAIWPVNPNRAEMGERACYAAGTATTAASGPVGRSSTAA